MHLAVRTIMLLGLAAGVACYRDGGTEPLADGITRIFLTDAGFPFDAVSRVEVYVTEIAASTQADTTAGAGAWVRLAAPHRAFDLLALQHGTTALLGEVRLPAGDYRAVRLSIDGDSSRIVWTAGGEARVRWPAAGEFTVHARVDEAMAVPTEGTAIVIDIDVGTSFTNAIADPLHDFLFVPFLRAVVVEATGTLRGTVRGDVDGNGILDPVTGAGLAVYRGDAGDPPSAWTLTATGHTDGAGAFVLGFLLAGTYIVQADAPAELTLGSLTAAHVTVAAGQDVSLPLVLPRLGASAPDLTVDGGTAAAPATPQPAEQSRSPR
jgi:hypothetical protein